VFGVGIIQDLVGFFGGCWVCNRNLRGFVGSFLCFARFDVFGVLLVFWDFRVICLFLGVFREISRCLGLV